MKYSISIQIMGMVEKKHTEIQIGEILEVAFVGIDQSYNSLLVKSQSPKDRQQSMAQSIRSGN